MSGSLTELSPPSLAGELLPCITCNRTFLPEALARHQNICQKTAHKKRKVFSSSKQRLQGTGIDPEEVRRSPSPPPRRRSASRASWRDKHTQLLNTVRSARGAAPAASSPAVPVDYEQCPFCARHFGPKAAERHISWCKDQKSRINTSSASAVAKNRLDARVKYQAPLPLKPRPKRLSVERLSREASPAVSVASSSPAPVPAVRSPTRQTRDYAREYRERASQEREQRLQERKRSPASVVSSGYGRQPASRLAREGSEPRATSPTKDAFRRTQSFRTRPAGTRATNLKHQRTADTLSGRSSGSVKQHHNHHSQHQHHQHQRRDEPDGGEDVPADRPGYQRSTSTPTEGHHGLHHHQHNRPSPSRQSDPFSGVPDRSPSPPPLPAGEEAYITRSQLDEIQRISDAVKQPSPAPSESTIEPDPGPSLDSGLDPDLDSGPEPDLRTETEPELGTEPSTPPSSAGVGRPPSLDELDASLTSERTSDGEGADTYRVTSGQVRRRLRQSGARRSGRSLGEIELTGTALRPSPRRAEPPPPPPPPSQPGKESGMPRRVGETPEAAVVAGPRGGAARRLVARPEPTRETRSPDEVFADSLEDLITVTECPVRIKPRPVAGRGGRPRGGGPPASGCVSLPALPPVPPPRPRPRPRRGGRITLPPLETRSGPPTGRHQPRPAQLQRPPAPPRRLSAAPAEETPPPADGGDSPPPPPPPPPHGWSELPWRPIDDSSLSSNRSSVERNGGGFHQLNFPGLSLAGDEREMSPSDSLYETEMPDFDLIMEQARRASERKNSALSPRKARMRGLDMREMMGIEVSDMNMKNGGGGSGATTPRFCHECGSQYPVQAAKFCCQCGAQKLCI